MRPNKPCFLLERKRPRSSFPQSKKMCLNIHSILVTSLISKAERNTLFLQQSANVSSLSGICESDFHFTRELLHMNELLRKSSSQEFERPLDMDHKYPWIGRNEEKPTVYLYELTRKETFFWMAFLFKGKGVERRKHLRTWFQKWILRLYYLHCRTKHQFSLSSGYPSHRVCFDSGALATVDGWDSATGGSRTLYFNAARPPCGLSPSHSSSLLHWTKKPSQLGNIACCYFVHNCKCFATCRIGKKDSLLTEIIVALMVRVNRDSQWVQCAVDTFPQLSTADERLEDALTVRWFPCEALRGLLAAIAQGSFRKDPLGETVRVKIYRYCLWCCGWGADAAKDQEYVQRTLSLFL